MVKIIATILLIPLFCSALLAESSSKDLLPQIYEYHCTQPSDINQHIPVLRNLASQCSSVIEIGVRHMVSTWGILQGLSESACMCRSYLGIDLAPPPSHTFQQAKQLSEINGISFDFWIANDMNIDIETVDMLFIDSLHTYCHLTYELEKFSSKVRKYIAMHDTSEPWGNQDADDYFGDYSEYSVHYDRNKRGLWPAVEDFLQRHPEWYLYERRLNNYGFTILRRVGS